MECKPTLRSQAHLQVAPTNAKTKTCKRACFPKRSADRKDAAKMKDRMTKDKNGQLVTTCIKHLAISGLSNVTARIKSSCNLTGNRFEMPNVSYTQPL